LKTGNRIRQAIRIEKRKDHSHPNSNPRQEEAWACDVGAKTQKSDGLRISDITGGGKRRKGGVMGRMAIIGRSREGDEDRSRAISQSNLP
jgi:hypothetical protein